MKKSSDKLCICNTAFPRAGKLLQSIASVFTRPRLFLKTRQYGTATLSSLLLVTQAWEETAEAGLSGTRNARHVSAPSISFQIIFTGCICLLGRQGGSRLPYLASHRQAPGCSLQHLLLATISLIAFSRVFFFSPGSLKRRGRPKYPSC